MSTFTKLGERGNHSEPKIVIVMPTLNEEAGIRLVMDDLRKFMHQYDYSVLVVDGYSMDRTVEIAKEKGASIIYQRANGYGDALMMGFEHANNHIKAEVIVMMDGDGTYDPRDISGMLTPILKNQADLVIGNRFGGMKEGAMTLTNRIGNRLLSWIARKTLGIKVSDTQCGLRALRASLMRNLHIKTRGMPFATEMLAEAKQAGAKIVEVPVVYRRRTGKTKLNPIKDGMRISGTILRFVRDYKPLLFFGGFGSILVLIGSVIGAAVVFEWIQTGSIVHLASVSLSSMLIITGFFTFMMGLLADMIKELREELREQTE